MIHYGTEVSSLMVAALIGSIMTRSLSSKRCQGFQGLDSIQFVSFEWHSGEFDCVGVQFDLLCDDDDRGVGLHVLRLAVPCSRSVYTGLHTGFLCSIGSAEVCGFAS